VAPGTWHLAPCALEMRWPCATSSCTLCRHGHRHHVTPYNPVLPGVSVGRSPPMPGMLMAHVIPPFKSDGVGLTIHVCSSSLAPGNLGISSRQAIPTRKDDSCIAHRYY
jgi:hypothetical protein